MLSGIIKRTTYLFIAAIMLTGFSLGQDKSGSPGSDEKTSFDLQAIDVNNDGNVYQCPMDFDVLSDKPGECSKCGMKLKEVTIEKASDNLVNKGYSVKTDENDNSIVHDGMINLNEIDANKDGMVYQDMMDYNVISDNPGTCPLCGMTLQEVSLEKAKMYLEKTGHKVK